jgi:tetratricopeptide (TPR) repeat protein
MTRLARYGSEHRDLAEILVAQGRFLEAISLYTKGISILEDAIRRQPLDVNAPVWLGHLQDARAKAQAKLDETNKASSPGGDSHLPSTSSR